MMNFPQSQPRNGQTFVFFLVAFTTVFLLCGLGLDSGLYYLAKARLSRALDASVITGVQNFAKPRDEVADIMRNIAIANYVDLADVSETPIKSAIPNGKGGTDFIYAYVGTNGDGAITHGITNTIGTGSEDEVVLARAQANAPYRTYFMAITGIDEVTSLDLAGISEAERRPRLITVVLDRSGSMITTGSSVLPTAVTNFLGEGDGVNGFDENADSIAIVSYSSFARLEMPHTKDFVLQGSNLMWKADGNNKNGRQVTENPTGMKFAGVTAADEGMRMALEIMRTNKGYNSPQVDKYIVFMTDGDFNSVRSLYAAPTYTNRIMMASSVEPENVSHVGMSFSPYTNPNRGGNQRSNSLNYHVQLPNLDDFDDSSMQIATLSRAAVPVILEPDTITDSSATVGSYNPNGAGTNPIEDLGKIKGVINVWLPPGSVAVHMDSVDGIPNSNTNAAENDQIVQNYFSYYTNSAVNIPLNPGEYIDLVLPGYVVDAVSSGFLTLQNNGTRNNFSSRNSYWPSYPQGEDPSDPTVAADYFIASDSANRPNSRSLYRHWMLRNRANLLWDYVLFKPEDGRFDGQEPYVTPPEPASLFYPGGMFIWSHNNYISGSAGFNHNGIPRASTNLVTSEPKFAGNTFFSAAGQLLNPDDWKNSAPTWLTDQFDSVMSVQHDPNPTTEFTDHDYPVWRPRTYNGDLTPDTPLGREQVYLMTNGFPYHAATNPITPPLATVGTEPNTTGGWCYIYENGVRKLKMNSMSFNSRPTYFFDHKDNRWESLTSWTSSSVMTQTGDWKALRYCQIARQEDVTVYTINFINGNGDLLKQMANDPAGPGYNPSEPEGEHITATTGSELAKAFEDISKKIRSVITQ